MLPSTSPGQGSNLNCLDHGGFLNVVVTDCNQGLQKDTVSFTRFREDERLTLPQGMVGQDYAWAVSIAASGACTG